MASWHAAESAPDGQLHGVTLAGVSARQGGAAACGGAPRAQPVHVLLHLWGGSCISALHV